MERDLPEGWKWVTYDQIGEWSGGGTPSKADPSYWSGGNIPWVSPKDMKSLRINSSEDKITSQAIENSSTKLIPSGSLIFVVRSGILRRRLPIAMLDVDATINQDLKALIPNDRIDKRYLLYCSIAFAEDIRRNCAKKGTTVQSINVSDLKTYSIPLPPLETQRRIVSILEKAEETERLRAQADELADRLIQSAFLEMFGDPLTNPMEWDIKMIEEICDRITDGEHATPKRTEEGIYLLSARNIQNHKFDLDDVDFIGDDEYERISKRIIPQVDDILISCSGTIGRVTRVRQHFKFQLVRSVALIRPITAIVDPTYLEYSFDTNLIKGQIDRAVNQSSQANLFQGKIKKLLIPLPPIHLQQQFAYFVERIEAMKKSQGKSAQELDYLFNALMQKAFTGEIVT